MFYIAKFKTMKIKNSNINYITFGKGPKPLIMIQGLNTNKLSKSAKLVALMYTEFIKDYTVYIFDRRSETFDGITVNDLASDVIDAMDALEIKNADILGVSEGGMIAQVIAIERSDLVRRLVLTVTASNTNELIEKTINNWISLTEEENYKELIKDMAYKLYSDRYLKKYKLFMPLLTLLQKPKDKEWFLHLLKSCLTVNTTDTLNQIKCETLVIGGKKDLIVGVDASYDIARSLNCDVKIYENLGHALYEEAKDFNKIVYNFFNE